MRTEVRVVVALGLAVAAWLFLVPTAASTGASCGVPVLEASEDDWDDGSPHEPDCVARNDTRLTQGVATALGAVVVLGVGAALAARRRAEATRPWVDPPRSHWEDA